MIVSPAVRSHAQAIWRQHGVTMEEMRSSSKLAHFSRARFEMCFRLAIIEGWSLPRVARRLRRDHTTVLHGVRRHANRELDLDFKTTLKDLRRAYGKKPLTPLFELTREEQEQLVEIHTRLHGGEIPTGKAFGTQAAKIVFAAIDRAKQVGAVQDESTLRNGAPTHGQG